VSIINSVVLSAKFYFMLNIVLFGPPGAGKGTQAFKLKSHYNLVHISTGDVLRGEIKNETTLGLEAQKFMDAGKLVPDEVVIGMIDNLIEANKDAKGFIFDGFPRTTAQAEALDKMLESKGEAISGMLALEVDDEELVRRLLLRGKDSGRADDRDQKVIAARIKEYNNKTAPLMEYYGAQNKFKAIKGVGAIDDIFGSLTAEIDKL
jgi:adenylate kinase